MPAVYAPKIGWSTASGARTSSASVATPARASFSSDTGPMPGSLRTASVADRNAGADAERARLVARRGDDAPPAFAAADHHRFSAERRIEEALDGHEERVEIDAADPREPHA